MTSTQVDPPDRQCGHREYCRLTGHTQTTKLLPSPYLRLPKSSSTLTDVSNHEYRHPGPRCPEPKFRSEVVSDRFTEVLSVSFDGRSQRGLRCVSVVLNEWKILKFSPFSNHFMDRTRYTFLTVERSRWSRWWPCESPGIVSLSPDVYMYSSIPI